MIHSAGNHDSDRQARPTQKRLFDEKARDDASPCGHAESSYAFLNRVAGAYWERVRRELERWYSAFPDDDGDLRQRFRSEEVAQHEAAWWELYIHRMLASLGFELEVHPALRGTSARPDFLAQRGQESLYVEAFTVFSGVVEEDRHEAREAELMDAIDAIDRRNWMVSLDFEAVGPESARRSHFVKQIERWLDSLEGPLDSSGKGHHVEFEDRGWRVHLTAMALDPPATREHHRLIGIGPGMVGDVNDLTQLQKAARRKMRRYGKPDLPVLLALLTSSTFARDKDIADLLLGAPAVRWVMGVRGSQHWVRQEDGLWVGAEGPRNAHISALLVGHQISCSNCARTGPRLWLHPHAVHPLGVDLPFKSATIHGLNAVFDDEAPPPYEWLGLPHEWPGPEEPFSD